MSVEKVIEHLEKAKEFLSEFVPASGHNPLNWIGARIDEALDLLRQQPDLEAENKGLKEIINECRTRRGYAESEECGEDLDQILKGK